MTLSCQARMPGGGDRWEGRERDTMAEAVTASIPAASHGGPYGGAPASFYEALSILR
jgi:hypothetical protein